MVSRLIALFLFLIAGAAYADDAPNIKQACQDLVAYQSNDDVEYKPGTDVDADGNPIAPADLDTGMEPLKIPETIHVAITVDQAQKLGLPANIPYRAEAMIGDVTVNKNGDVYFNGQRISQPQLQVLCKEENGKATSNSDQK